MAGAQIGNHFRDKERIESRRAVSTGINLDLLLEGEEPSDSRTPDDACAVGVDLVRVQAGIFYRFIGNDHGPLRKGIHLPGLFAVHEISNVKVFYFAGEPGFIESGIKSSNRGCTARTVLQSFPELRNSIPDRRECT